MRSFLRRKLVLDIFSEVRVDFIPCLGYYFPRKSYPMIFVLLCIAQSEGDLWRFHMEAQETYMCKQILGLCQAATRKEMSLRSTTAKKNNTHKRNNATTKKAMPQITCIFIRLDVH